MTKYLHLIQEDSKKKRGWSVNALPCLYLVRQNFSLNSEMVSGWIKADPSSPDLLLIPINKMDHLSLVIVDTKQHFLSTMTQYRAGRRNTSNELRVMKKFLPQRFEKNGKSLTVKTKIESRALLQTNSYDCGVFAKTSWREEVNKKEGKTLKTHDERDIFGHTHHWLNPFIFI